MGKFCNNCGAALRTTCPSCGASLTPTSKFCHECGTGSARSGSSATARPWIIAVAAVAVAGLVTVTWFTAVRPRVEVPVAAAPGSGRGATTDLSLMSPRERADRLFNRVMGAHERGDRGEVDLFAPMAIQAYALLGAMDHDARYHLALLYSAGGPIAMALLQADSLDLEAPGHLFVAMLRGTLARISGDTLELRRAYRSFLDHYEREMAAAKPEYAEHQTSIGGFLTEARSALDGEIRR